MITAVASRIRRPAYGAMQTPAAHREVTAIRPAIRIEPPKQGRAQL